MAVVPEGAFSMGDAFTEGDVSERPVHSVAISTFLVDRFEVSNAQVVEAMNWAETQGMVSFSNTGSSVYIYAGSQRVLISSLSVGGIRHSMVDNKLTSAPDMANHPCVNINWYGALAYCNARSGIEQLEPCYSLSSWTCDFSKDGYRLPTESEWEYAARGGLAGHHFPWSSSGGTFGDHVDGSHANYRASGDPYANTTPVGYYDGGQTPAGTDMANGYGLYDMAGNAAELCWDCYDANWYANAASGNADTRGPTVSSVSGTVEERVVRPGSWNTPTSYLRCASRLYTTRTAFYTTVGFRCARKLVPSITAPTIDESIYYTTAAPPKTISVSGGGSTSTCGEGIEYRFDFGDGHRNTWSAAQPGNTYTSTRSWSSTGSCELRIQARTVSGSCTSDWSEAATVWVASLTVTDVTKDPEILFPNEPLVLTPTATFVNLPPDGILHWQGDWDGDVSYWVPQTAFTQSWSQAGTYYVKFWVRDARHPQLISNQYPPHDQRERVHVNVNLVKTPVVTGPGIDWGWAGEPYIFTATAQTAAAGPLEYRFWIDYTTQTDWSLNTSITNVWPSNTGDRFITAQARVAGDPATESPWLGYPGCRFLIVDGNMATIPDHTFVMGLAKPVNMTTMSDYFAAATSTHGQVLSNVITNERFQARLDWIATARVDQVVWEPEIWNRVADSTDTPEERAVTLNVMSNLANSMRSSILGQVGRISLQDEESCIGRLTLNVGASSTSGFPPGFDNRLNVTVGGVSNDASAATQQIANRVGDTAALIAQRIGESAKAAFEAAFESAVSLEKEAIEAVQKVAREIGEKEQGPWWSGFGHPSTWRSRICPPRAIMSAAASPVGGLRLMAGDCSSVGHDVRVSAFKMARYEVSNREMVTVLQWAYDQGHVAVSGGWAINTVGSPRNLVHVGNPDSQVRFSGGVFSATAGKANFPCVMVTWYGAMAYCHYRTLMDPVGTVRLDLADWSYDFSRIGAGQTYRLPTEAEWEAAARGGLDFHGQPLTFVWTNVVCANPLLLDFFVVSNAANFANSGDPYEQLPDPQTTPCGDYEGSPCQASWIDPAVVTNGLLFDIIGNVEEWCYDYYTNSWYSEHAASYQDTTGPTGGTERVVRGGSWQSAQNGAFGELRLGHRDGADPLSTTAYRGFRYVKVSSGPPVMEDDPIDDGIPDGWERQYGQVANLSAEGDYDQDGMTDLREHLAGTNPLDPYSRLWLYHNLSVESGKLRLAWQSVMDRLYRVERANGPSGTFTPVSATMGGTGEFNVFTVNVNRAAAPEHGLYRIRVSTP